MDHIVIAAERINIEQEHHNWGACIAAAAAAGVSPDDADECDDGAHSCPTCPWRNTAGNWKVAA